MGINDVIKQQSMGLGGHLFLRISNYCSSVSLNASVDKPGKRVTGDRNNLRKDYKINGNMIII